MVTIKTQHSGKNKILTNPTNSPFNVLFRLPLSNVTLVHSITWFSRERKTKNMGMSEYLISVSEDKSTTEAPYF